MTYVSDFKHDLFVSYAHFDNDEDAQDVRWVSRFQADLKNALRQRLGEEPDVFFDTRNFEAADHVDFLLENARRSALFLAVFSPSYVAREFTNKELQAFCERAGDYNRVVTVELLPVEDDTNHPLLRGRKRTPFWWKDRAEQDVPLRLTAKFNPEMYNERLQILAHDLKKLLAEMREGGARRAVAADPARPAAAVDVPRPAVAVAPGGRAVLLAQATDDLYDERERVRAHLEQFGMKVLPEHDYPQGGAAFAAEFETDLAQSGLFVQLLGSFGSRKPPDLSGTYSQYQYDAAKGHGLKILQWRRPDLDLTAITHRDKPLLEGPDVLAIGLEEFKGEILRAWAPPQEKAQVQQHGDCHIFINADRSDKELADTLLKLFEDRKNCTAARPLFEGSAKEIVDDLETNLVNCGALLLLYGSAPPAWVRAQLLRYGKLEKQRDGPLLLKSIVLGPPAPKAELAWSGGFDRIDCQDGDIVQRVRAILAGLQF
jgi:hypothetical protein